MIGLTCSAFMRNFGRKLLAYALKVLLLGSSELLSPKFCLLSPASYGSAAPVEFFAKGFAEGAASELHEGNGSSAAANRDDVAGG